MMPANSSFDQRFRRLHTVASANYDSAAKVLQELEALRKEMEPAPEASRPKRKNRITKQIEQNAKTGTWSKPLELRKKHK